MLMFLISLLLCSSYFVIADISARAASLNLTNTWYLPFPSSTESSAFDYIVNNWYTSSKKTIYGSSDISFVKDPIDSSNNATAVFKVDYPANSYAPVGTKNDNSGNVGGVEFFSIPNGDTYYNSALLSYQLAFDPTFQWVKGGKLPGLFGGAPNSGCSGGEAANGNNCFSVRMMWRANNAGEAYAYIPETDALCKKTSNVICNSDYGISFSRGVINFSTNKWTTIEIYVKLNSGSDANGILQVWQDGSLMINQQKIQYRVNQTLGVSSLFFSTFFGGGTSDYATPVDTATYFRNIQFSVGNTPDPAPTGTASSLSIPDSILYSMAILTLFVYTFIL